MRPKQYCHSNLPHPATALIANEPQPISKKLFHDRAERANRLASAGLLCAARAEMVAGRQSLSRLVPCSGGFELLRRLRNGRLSLLAESTLGKFYAANIKQYDGIPLDEGSVVDGWTSRRTRPGMGADMLRSAAGALGQ